MFNLLEQVLCEAYGPESWDQLIYACDASGVYASLGSYPDIEFLRLIDTAAAITGRSREAMLRDFGEAAFPLMAESYSGFMDGITDARTFLLSLNRIIHAEVRKLYAGAGCPQFRFAIAPRHLRIGYSSPRRLCALAEGLIQGVANHFQEQIKITHSECMQRGDSACRVDVMWTA